MLQLPGILRFSRGAMKERNGERVVPIPIFGIGYRFSVVKFYAVLEWIVSILVVILSVNTTTRRLTHVFYTPQGGTEMSGKTLSNQFNFNKLNLYIIFLDLFTHGRICDTKDFCRCLFVSPL